jgi:hypothetical protein
MDLLLWNSRTLPENLRLMLGADELLDLRGVLDRGELLFIFLGKGAGVPEEQVHVLGSLVLQLLFQATYARERRSHRYLLAADEFFHLLAAPALTRRFETALTTIRSFGLSLMLVNHNFAQLSPSLREIVLGNTDFAALFRTSGRNADFFGDFLPESEPELVAKMWSQGRTTRGDEARRHRLEALQRLPDRTLYWYDRRKPYRALRLRGPDVAPPHEAAGLSPDELEELVRREGWDRGRAAVSRATLRAQVEARKRRLLELLRPPARVSVKVGEPSAPKKGKRSIG